jgi:vacuolar iron transporter family protein
MDEDQMGKMGFMRGRKRSFLKTYHEPGAIRQRLDQQHKHSYLGDAILGGIDGGITTFAVVAGAIGAGFPQVVIIILGFANLLADGFSMAISNYLGTKSRRDRVKEARKVEEEHIKMFPEGEREEIRQIYAGKGFYGAVLDAIVDGICQDKEQWVDTMIREEYRLPVETPSPVSAGAATFFAFLSIGLIPLIPFVIPNLSVEQRFIASSIATAIAFFSIGLAKGAVLNGSAIRSGIETLLTGGGAAVLAYVIGSWLQQTFGA